MVFAKWSHFKALSLRTVFAHFPPNLHVPVMKELALGALLLEPKLILSDPEQVP